MCKAIQDMKKEAADKTLLDSIKNLMKNLKLTAEQAMDALGIAAEDRSRFVSML